MITAHCVLNLAMLLLGSMAQFLTPPIDLVQTTGYMNLSVRYKEVPDGICEMTPGVKSFTGYIDIGPEYHMFFWFFEARNRQPTTAPLTVWIDGRPGVSAMSTLFAEMGPCSVNSNLDIVYNPYSWNNITNIIFIDSPVNTGFSYTNTVPGYISAGGNLIQLPGNDCPSWLKDLSSSCGTYSSQNDTMTANSSIGAAPAYWKAIQGFTGAFPQYSQNGFHFTTESYGGHFGPVFNAYSLNQNELIANGSLDGTGAHYIDLRSMMIGNGWYDPIVGYEAFYNFTVWPGNTYDLRPFHPDIEERMFNAMWGPGNCRDMLLQCNSGGQPVEVCADGDDFCGTEVMNLLVAFADREIDDIRELNSDPFPYGFYQEYLNQEHVLKAIGAFINYTEQSITVLQTFTDTGDDGRIDGTVRDVSYIRSQGVYVVEYAGDADYTCNWLGGEVIANRTGPISFTNAGYADMSTSDGIVHGQVKQAENFAFARIYESGHEVPFYQPLAALTMLERVLAGKDVATGKYDVQIGDDYRTVGPSRSTYREGNSTVVYRNLSPYATYNTTSNRPNPPGSSRQPSSRKRKISSP